MEQIVSLVRDYMHAEADAGYPLLRQIPSTRATACLDYLESIPAPRRPMTWHAWSCHRSRLLADVILAPEIVPRQRG